MRRLWAIAVAVFSIMLAAPPADANSSGQVQTESLWRGVLSGDSVFVLATWKPTSGESTCTHRGGFEEDEPDAVSRQYLDYRIISQQGRVFLREELAGPEIWTCCSSVGIAVSPWQDGVVFTVAREVAPCAPAGSCTWTRYIYVPRHGPVAIGPDGDWLQWDPEQPGLIPFFANLDCIQYAMTLEPRVTGSTLEFVPRLPPEIKPGELVEVPLDEVDGFQCNRVQPAEPISVPSYATFSATVTGPLPVMPTDRVEVVTVVYRAVPRPQGGLGPQVIRFGVQIGPKRAYLTLTSLGRLGYLFYADVKDPESTEPER